MALFGRKKVKTKDCGCGECCEINVDEIKKAQVKQVESAIVKILGSGCKKCNQLEANTKVALEQLGMSTDIDHVTDFAQIATYGVITTPALVVNRKVISYGKLLTSDEIIKLLQKN